MNAFQVVVTSSKSIVVQSVVSEIVDSTVEVDESSEHPESVVEASVVDDPVDDISSHLLPEYPMGHLHV